MAKLGQLAESSTFTEVWPHPGTGRGIPRCYRSKKFYASFSQLRLAIDRKPTFLDTGLGSADLVIPAYGL
jgi:hypothetical protein